jgi:hypothetical protein
VLSLWVNLALGLLDKVDIARSDLKAKPLRSGPVCYVTQPHGLRERGTSPMHYSHSHDTGLALHLPISARSLQALTRELGFLYQFVGIAIYIQVLICRYH